MADFAGRIFFIIPDPRKPDRHARRASQSNKILPPAARRTPRFNRPERQQITVAQAARASDRGKALREGRVAAVAKRIVMLGAQARDQAEWTPVSRTQVGYSRLGRYISAGPGYPRDRYHALNQKVRARTQISIRNLRELDCFPQNRFPLLLTALYGKGYSRAAAALGAPKKAPTNTKRAKAGLDMALDMAGSGSALTHEFNLILAAKQSV
jgi:hypothetical protein